MKEPFDVESMKLHEITAASFKGFCVMMTPRQFGMFKVLAPDPRMNCFGAQGGSSD